MLRNAEDRLSLAVGYATVRNTKSGTQPNECMQRFLSLDEALVDFEEIRDCLPQEYQRNVNRILQNAHTIEQLFADYQFWEKAHGARLFSLDDLLLVALKLQRIDPDRFSSELVHITDDEFILLSLPQERLIWDGLFRRSRLAEYDPERFRKLFGQEYTTDHILSERKRWARIAAQQDMPNCVEAWQRIEHALQLGGPSIGSAGLSRGTENFAGRRRSRGWQ